MVNVNVLITRMVGTVRNVKTSTMINPGDLLKEIISTSVNVSTDMLVCADISVCADVPVCVDVPVCADIRLYADT